MKTIALQSPSKLNLFLHITGRQPNGYHELETLFLLIDAHDDMHFSVRDDAPDITLTVTNHPELHAEPTQNLIYKAAALLQQTTQCKRGCDITLTKNLPLGGGIGGGSSNAATTLLALNSLWNTSLSLAELAALGKRLGADVPVFIRGYTAWATGIGDMLTPADISPLITPDHHIVLLTPNAHANTAELFSAPALVKNTPVSTFSDFLAAPETYHNCFEPVVLARFPQVNTALQYLVDFQRTHNLSHPISPRLTGSGSSVFAVFETQDLASTCLQHAPCRGLICSALHTSIVHKILNYQLK